MSFSQAEEPKSLKLADHAGDPKDRSTKRLRIAPIIAQIGSHAAGRRHEEPANGTIITMKLALKNRKKILVVMYQVKAEIGNAASERD